GRIEQPGLFGRVRERAVTPVVKQRTALTFVRFRRAVRLALAVERAEQILLDRPVDIVGDEQIELAVVVVVEPQRAGREPRAGNAGTGGDIDELAAADVAEQVTGAECRQVNVDLAVVVEIGSGAADAVDLDVEAGSTRHVGKGAVVAITVQRWIRLRPRVSG